MSDAGEQSMYLLSDFKRVLRNTGAVLHETSENDEIKKTAPLYKAPDASVSIFAQDNNFLRSGLCRDAECSSCVVHKQLRIFRAAHKRLPVCRYNVGRGADVKLQGVVVRYQAVIKVG